MRIDQLVASYQQQALRRFQSSGTTTSSDNRAPTSPGLAAAQRANQHRLDDAVKGFVQASTVRDSINTLSTSITNARNLINQAHNPRLSATERATLQTNLTAALASATKASGDHRTALTDKRLTNGSYDAKRSTAVDTERLGTGASRQFNNVAQLSRIDLRTASADELAEADKVLIAAQRQLTAPLANANADRSRQAQMVNRYDSVQQTIAPPTNLGSTSATLLPGSLFSSVA